MRREMASCCVSFTSGAGEDVFFVDFTTRVCTFSRPDEDATVYVLFLAAKGEFQSHYNYVDSLK